jgi:hypothetical protein
MEEKMKELIIPLIQFERPTVTADIGPTPVEIQRWEDDGGAVLPSPQRRASCHCAVDHRRRAAA